MLSDRVIRILFRVFQSALTILIMAFAGFLAAAMSVKAPLEGPVAWYDLNLTLLILLVRIDSHLAGLGQLESASVRSSSNLS